MNYIYQKSNKELSEFGCLVPTPIVEEPKPQQFIEGGVEALIYNADVMKDALRQFDEHQAWKSGWIPVSKEFSDRYENGWIGTEKDFKVDKCCANSCDGFKCKSGSVHDVAYPLERDNEEGQNIIEPAANQYSNSVASHSCTTPTQMDMVVKFLRKKIATNSRKWDRAQTTHDKIKFGGKARVCKEILDYVQSVVMNDEPSVATDVS